MAVTTARKPTTSEIESVFNYWNKKGIIKHRVLTDKIRRRVKSQLRYYTVVEVCKSIFNYSEILYSETHYWTYKWTLEFFLQRGLERFMDDADPYENFRATYPVTKEKPRTESNTYKKRYEQWQKAGPEERRELERRWKEEQLANR